MFVRMSSSAADTPNSQQEPLVPVVLIIHKVAE
jgi:hypothetical protein